MMAKTRRWSRAGSVFVAAALVACGRAESDGDETNTGGDGGRESTGGASPSDGGATVGGASSGAAAGRAQTSGGEDLAGAAGLGGQGGASECPAIKCTAQCADYWVGLDGCNTCACAPPAPKLAVRDVSCPLSALTLTETSSYYVGGYNRWLLDFDWQCSDTSLLGEPSRAHLQVGLLEPISPPIDAKNRTFFFPTVAGAKVEYEIR